MHGPRTAPLRAVGPRHVGAADFGDLATDPLIAAGILSDQVEAGHRVADLGKRQRRRSGRRRHRERSTETTALDGQDLRRDAEPHDRSPQDACTTRHDSLLSSTRLERFVRSSMPSTRNTHARRHARPVTRTTFMVAAAMASPDLPCHTARRPTAGSSAHRRTAACPHMSG